MEWTWCGAASWRRNSSVSGQQGWEDGMFLMGESWVLSWFNGGKKWW
jgi:hypothetical protein